MVRTICLQSNSRQGACLLECFNLRKLAADRRRKIDYTSVMQITCASGFD